MIDISCFSRHQTIFSFLLFLVLNIVICYPIEDDTLKLKNDDHSLNNTFPYEVSGEECEGEILETNTLEFLKNKSISENGTEPVSYKIVNGKICLQVNSLKCPKKKLIYEPEEFILLSNGSVLVFGEIIDEGSYEIVNGKLLLCEIDYDSNEIPQYFENSYTNYVLIQIGRTGTAISIIALCLHLIVFCMVPSMRTFPGYNLASLSVALLMAYIFVLFGQIPSVLGTLCIMSAAFQHYFFLVVFFWMNVMAFDVWRALSQAIHNLVPPSNKPKISKFLLYSVYSWGLPLILAGTAIAVDQSDYFSEKYKPSYGDEDICWFTNSNAIAVFFIAPVFTLIAINAIFFLLSAFMIYNSTVKVSNDLHNNAKRNLVLYARLGLLMGVTWLIAIIGVILNKQVIWFVFDICNSLQGLFVFLLFSCSKKVWYHLRNKAKTGTSLKTTSTAKNSSSGVKSESHHI